MATTAVMAASVGVILVGYFALPMEIGIWWYVFPREATAALYLSMALVPDLGAPATGRRWAAAAHPWVQTASAALMTWSAWSASALTARHWEVFDRATRDFGAITTEIPSAPRLLYLVFDHGGSTRRQTPFLHLPAYVQAERGGHLSFHFAMWDASPVRYRTDAEAVVPPPVPLRWEWQPAQFRVKKHAPFFDWFLVRSRSDPTHLFADDPEIQPVRHEGTWCSTAESDNRRPHATGSENPVTSASSFFHRPHGGASVAQGDGRSGRTALDLTTMTVDSSHRHDRADRVGPRWRKPIDER